MERDRREAATLFGCDVVVDASAGTGKTATLVARVTNLFLRDRDLLPDRVLLLTFTEKAAAEMTARLAEGWERLRTACRTRETADEVRGEMAEWNPLVEIPGDLYGPFEELRERAEELVDASSRLSVTTFHSFCRRILLSFPAEAAVDPRFEVLPEEGAREAWDAGFRAFLRAEFGREETDPRWEEALSRVRDPGKAWALLRSLCLTQRDLLEGPRLDFGSPRDLLDHLAREYGEAVRWFRAFVGGIADPEHGMVPAFRGALETLERGWEAVCRGDGEAAFAIAPRGVSAFGFPADRTRSPKTFPRPPGFTLAGARDRLREFFALLADAPAGDAAARFLVDRAREALGHYRRAKGSGLDFMDLLLRAHGLLAQRPDVAARLAERFRYVFVDEFQDTDPLQAGMLRILCPEESPGKLFAVGDPKQSIYGFRRADIQVYHRFGEDLRLRGGRGIGLARNFRSRPDLIDSVNGLFREILRGGEDFAPEYRPVAAYRKDPGGGPPATFYTLGDGVPEEEFVASLVRRVVGSVPVATGSAPERPASWRDVAILFRSDTGGRVLPSLREALRRAGIPHVVPPRRGFYDRPEVQDLRIVLAAVDAPADPSARYAALKTLFFGLSDDELLPLFHDGAGAPSARARDGAALLAAFSARRGRSSLSSLVSDLYRESGVEFVAARLPEGDRIVQNLAKARALASRFERSGGGQVRAFLEELGRRAPEESGEHEVPAYDEGENAVQVSTIHAAKGLEFPVVILANLSRGGAREPEGLRVDRVRGLAAVLFPGFRTFSAWRGVPGAEGEVPFLSWERRKQEAEEARLLYVAATRARDRLFLVRGSKGQGSEILSALARGLSRAEGGGAMPCPLTGLPGTLRRFPESAGPGTPGGSIFCVAVERPLSTEPPPGEAAPPLPAVPAPSAAPPEGGVALPASAATVPVRELLDREAGRRFGEKVHRALEAYPPVGGAWPPAAPVPVDWAAGEPVRWAAICDAVAGSDLFRRLRAASVIGTEFPLLSFRDGWATEERADLVVRVPAGPGPPSGGEIWVVDYKTGRRDPETEGEYVAQVRGYREILSGAWRRPVRGFLWYVETGEAVEA